MSRVAIISASAGTGKTTRLAQLIHEAVAAKAARPEAVLATTFTNRAAAELAERARQTLLRDGEASAAHRLNAARVGTVNSVCGSIVRDFAFLHGVSPRVSVLAERKAEDEPIRAGSEALPRDLLNELEDLRSRLGPVRGRPGGNASYGEWDWWEDVKRIMALARSNAIAPERFGEFAQRSTQGLLELLGSPAMSGEALDRVLEAALEGFRARVDLEADTTGKTEKAYGLVRFALARGVSKLTWSDWAGLAQLDPGKKSQAIADPVREAAAAHDRHPRLRDDLRRAVKAVFDAAAYALGAYQEHKRGLGVIDFVDQETEALTLLHDEAVREQLREEIDLVLVDEFQDTSPIQLAIFLQLSKIAPRSVWVGDPKQAIYGFRGSDPAPDGSRRGDAAGRQAARDARPLLAQPPRAGAAHLGSLRPRVRRVGHPCGAGAHRAGQDGRAEGPRSHPRALGAGARRRREWEGAPERRARRHQPCGGGGCAPRRQESLRARPRLGRGARHRTR